MDLIAFVIEMHADIRITLRRFNNRGVERCASDRSDTFFRIDIVRAKMQCAGSIVNHPTAHRDRMLQCFLGDSDLFQCVNAACRNCQIDRAPANDVPFPRISAPLVKIHFVSAPTEICREQSSRQSAADKYKFCHSPKIYESRTQAATDAKQRPSFQSRKDCETDASLFRSLHY